MPRYSGRNRRSSSSSSSSRSRSRSRSPYNKYRRERSRSPGRSGPSRSRRSPSPKRRRPDSGRPSYRRLSPRRYSRSRSASPRRRRYSRSRSASPRRRRYSRSRSVSPRRRSTSRRSPPRRSSPRRSPPRRSPPRRSPVRRSSPRRPSPRRSPPRRSPPRSPPRRLSPRRSPPRRASPRRSSPRKSPPRRSSPRRLSPRSPLRRSSPRRSPLRKRSRSASPQRRKYSSSRRSASPVIRRSRSPSPRKGRLESHDHKAAEPSRSRTHYRRHDSYDDDQAPQKSTPFKDESHDRWGDRERASGTARPHEHRDRDERLERDRIASGSHSQQAWDGSPQRGRSRSPVPRQQSSPSRDMDLRKPMGWDRGHDEDLRRRKPSPSHYSHPRQDSPTQQEAPPCKLGHTGTSLHDRFGDGGSTSFTPDENITVGIERNITGDEEAVIHHLVDPETVIIVRRAAEGEVPMCEREEFKAREEEYIERRVIRVVRPESDSVKRYEQQYQRENFEVRRDKFQSRMDIEPSKPSLNERWKSDERRIEPSASYSKRDREKVEVVRREDRAYDSYTREHRSEKTGSGRKEDVRNFEVNRSGRESRTQESGRHGDLDDRQKQKVLRVYGDKDERVITQRRFSGEFRRDEDLRSEREKYERDPSDLRHNLVKRRSSGLGRDDQFDARHKLTEKRREEERRKSAGDRGREVTRTGDRIEIRRTHELPDFSRRADKGVFEEWKQKPEMVPKGTSYFEHDNRGEINYWERRGRGRGRGTRGRGIGWGGSRGFRGGRDSRRPSFGGGGDWKHDKFQELEDDSDNKPSSTTTT